MMIIKEASHDELIRSGNKSYMSLMFAYTALQAEAKGIRYVQIILPASGNYYLYSRESFNALTQSIHSAPGLLGMHTAPTPPSTAIPPINSSLTPTNPTNLAPVDRSEYPNVRFWLRKDWEDSKETDTSTKINQESRSRGRTRVSNGENVSLKFVEDRNGDPIDGHRVTDLRALTRQIFFYFRDQGVAPASWALGSHLVQSYYRSEMYERFPELRLCINHWKVDLIATTCYPG